MSEWWTYTLTDFLLFSPRTYQRLYELYNRDIWPGQVFALVLGLAALLLARRGGQAAGRIVAAILAAFWAWIAGAFQLERYSTINWAATYFAAAFALEALLLVWTGVIRGRLAFAASGEPVAQAGLALLLFALFVEPLLGPLAGRQWVAAEIFGVAPDPTVIGTLGLLLCAGNGRHWHLLAIPMLWCAVSGAILWAMRWPDALTLPLTAIATLLLAALKPTVAPAQRSG